MSEKVIENNKVSVIGEVVSEFKFSHEVFGEGFYVVDMAVSRLSDQVDIIPLMVSERLLDVSKDYQGCTMEALGQFRSYNRHEGTKNRLVLSIFVREVNFLEEFTAISARNRFTGKLLLAGKLQISCWPLTVRMENPTTYPVLHGEEMPDMHQALRLAAESASGGAYRAGNIRKN